MVFSFLYPRVQGSSWRPRGEAFAAVLAQWPDLRFEKTRVYIGEGHWVSEYLMSGTADGERFACDGVDVIAVDGGRVARKDTYFDWPALQRQLGGEPLSAIPT